MKKIILIILLLIFLNTGAQAIEIVYPKTNPAKIAANSTFFIGSTKPNDKLQINNMQVKVSPSGAFAQVVPLSLGKNDFTITSSNDSTPPEIINFTIERIQPVVDGKKIQPLIEYPVLNNFYVKKDNTPLRKTPVDSGINRISNLPKDMQLSINGEKSGFYRVYLSSKLSGWVAKSDLEQRGSDDIDSISVKVSDQKTSEDKDFCIYEYKLDRMTPFSVKEEKDGKSLTLELYNIEGQLDNLLTLNIPMTKIIGYDAYYEKNKFIFKVRKTPVIDITKPLKDITIAIDAGHGGSEYGAIGGCGDKEKDINLSIAKELQKELEARGAKVIMTRNDDINVSLQDRVKTARDKNAVLSISIHSNALPDGADPNKCRGTSVYYYHNQAKPLAECILNSMTTELNINNDKVRQGSLALTRATSSVSVLIEVAYIINPDDCDLLVDKTFQTNCAKAIADGIGKFLLN